MHYIYLTNNVVTDQAQVDPFNIFAPEYAEGFIEAADEVTFGWTYEDGQFSPPPGPTPQDLLAQCKAKAGELLSATDWVENPSVSNASSSVYLTNKVDFLTYRDAVRVLAVFPVEDPVWPEKPEEKWGSSLK